MDKLLEELNPMQRKAVEQTEGPCLVIAGAGSGKTKVLTYKIAYLMEHENVMPWNILAITFTNKAANEMKERVEKLVGNAINDIWLGTFHSICVRILRTSIDRLGYDKSFIIFETTDQKTLMKQVLKELNVDTKMFSEKSVLNAISNTKNEMIEPEEYQEENSGNHRKKVIGKAYALYQRKLKENNAIDFDDIINFTIKILKNNPDVLEHYAEKFKYILVDEYQDTNKAQFTLISTLADKFKNITAVGDSDQSIYSFRGADITNILNFERDFPGTKIVKLEQNYRCTKNILKAANEVIKNNGDKYDKKLWTENEEGKLPNIFCGEDEYDESSYVVQQINHLRREEYYKYSDFAVLYRMNAQSRAIEDVLRREDIPYKIIGGLKFYERKEIKDIIAYLRLIANPSDNLALTRIINEPKRGVGKTSMENVQKLAEENQISMYEIIKRADSFLPRIFTATRDFIKSIEELRALDVEEIGLEELIKQTLEKTGYLQALKNEKTIEAESRIENLEEFLTVAIEFEKEAAEKTLQEFLNSISLSSDTDNIEESDDMVTLMTLHSAKGLEYPVIFLVGLEEGIFPGYQSMADEREIQEERRLFYVGITRAQKYLYITFSKRRMIFGSTSYNPPSRFIKEIPKKLLDGYDEAMHNRKKKDEFEDSDTEWSYGKNSRFGKVQTSYSNSWNSSSTDFNRNWGKSSGIGFMQESKINSTSGLSYAAKGFDSGSQGFDSGLQGFDSGTQRSDSGAQGFNRTANSFLREINAKKKSESVDISKYQLGQNVFHKKFGEGVITKIEPEGDDCKLDINFQKFGMKRLMGKFARLEILD